MSMEVIFSGQLEVKEAEKIEEKKGSLAPSADEDKLMRSVLQSDKKSIDDGKLITESLNQGLGVFNPDMMLEQMVQNFSLAKQLYGPKLLRLAFSYDPNYIGRNIKLPEFQKELKGLGQAKKHELENEKLTKKSGKFSELGIKLSAAVTLVEEIERMFSKGSLGFAKTKKQHPFGDKHDVRHYRQGDRFRDVSLRDSVKLALRRSHKAVQLEDLKSHTRRKKSEISIIYAIDASSSMKGDKLEACKKAGMALAYQALQNRDKVGLIAFGSSIKEEVEPASDFWRVMNAIASVRASAQTNIQKTIQRSIEMFPRNSASKHLVLITDAAPTVGTDPKGKTLEAAGRARDHEVSISLVGISLEREAKIFSRKLVEAGGGRFYSLKNIASMDQIVLEDYYELSKA